VSEDVDAFNALLERLDSEHRVVPGTLVGPDIARVLHVILDRLERLEKQMSIVMPERER
jgi:hypothetical protein